MSSDFSDQETTWTRGKIKSLRLRLGWSQADLARRLNCSSTDIELWESGSAVPTSDFANELFLVGKQADTCSREVHRSPQVETLCEQKALAQIEFSEIKEEIE